MTIEGWGLRDRRARWQLDGSGPEAYERYLVPVFFAPWAARLVDLVPPRPGTRVLDVACGTGAVARRAAAAVGDGGTIVGLDVNEGMLQVARAAGDGVRPAIEWRQANVEEMPFPDGTFDVAFCQQGLQFFPDRRAALVEMRRVLAPMGQLALSVWRPLKFSPGFMALTRVLERHAGANAASIMRTPFSSLNRDEWRGLLTGAGWRDVHIRVDVGSARFPSPEEFVRQEAISSPLGEPIAALDSNVYRAMVRDLGETLRPYTDDDGVVFPMESYLVTARP